MKSLRTIFPDSAIVDLRKIWQVRGSVMPISISILTYVYYCPRRSCHYVNEGSFGCLWWALIDLCTWSGWAIEKHESCWLSIQDVRRWSVRGPLKDYWSVRPRSVLEAACKICIRLSWPVRGPLKAAARYASDCSGSLENCFEI